MGREWEKEKEKGKGEQQGQVRVQRCYVVVQDFEKHWVVGQYAKDNDFHRYQ